MDALHVPIAAAALLLVPSGVWKLLRPADTRRAMRTAGVPSSTAIVRTIGAAEVVVGIGAIVGDARAWAVALAATYAAFAVFVVLALWRRAPLRSCGCFGDRGTAPTPLHVGIDAGVAAVAVIAAADGIAAPLDVVRDGGADAVALVGLSIVLATMLYLALTRDLLTTEHPRQGAGRTAE